MLLGDFKTLADWMTALIDHMEGTGSILVRNLKLKVLTIQNLFKSSRLTTCTDMFHKRLKHENGKLNF